jgi:very-short-patch-repair endonuclease
MSAQLFDAIEQHVEERRSFITEQAHYFLALQQSPIEEKMGLALLAHYISAFQFFCVLPELPEADRTGLFMVPQAPIGRYRADFALLMMAEGQTARLVVECDGHDFHEKTKQQAAHDKARDRYFVQKQWPVMRFTGSEIYRDANRCADQAMMFLVSAHARATGKTKVAEALEWVP